MRAIGQVKAVQPRGGDVELIIDAGGLDLSSAAVGESVSVSGACLTVTRLEPGAFAADVSRETLALTTLGALQPGARVNLEPALRAGEALGGHFVTGHVDGTARVTGIADDGRSWRMQLEVPAGLARYLAPKGSVTIDGVSLTVNQVDGRCFGVNLIPHTREVTTLGALAPGSRVNLEVDLIARYLERLADGRP